MKKIKLLLTLLSVFILMISIKVVSTLSSTLFETIEISHAPINTLLYPLASITISQHVVDEDSSITKELARVAGKLEHTYEHKMKLTLAHGNVYKAHRNVNRVSKSRNKIMKNLLINNDELIHLEKMNFNIKMKSSLSYLAENFRFPEELNGGSQATKTLIAKMEDKEKSNTVMTDQVSFSAAALDKLSSAEELAINEMINGFDLTEFDKQRSLDKLGETKSTKDDLIFINFEEVASQQDKKFVTTQKNDPSKKKNLTEVENNKILEEIMAKMKPKAKSKKTIAMTTQDATAKDGYSDVAIRTKSSGLARSDYSEASLILKATEVNIGKNNNALMSFRFIPEVGKSFDFNSDADGVVEIVEKLNGDMGVMSGTILSSGNMPTNVDLVLEEGQFLIDVPVINREVLYNLFKEDVSGAFLLVELDESIDSVDIDHDYQEKIFLSSSFKVVSEEEKYQFILFAGIEPGNTLLQYITFKDELAQKIVNLREEEVYYEPSTMLEGEREVIELFDENILGKAINESSIEESEITYFNTNITARGLGISLFEIDRPLLPLGTRKHLQLGNLGEKTYLGYWNEQKISIPSREYYDYILEKIAGGDLENKCLIQINIKKELAEFDYSAWGVEGQHSMEVFYLDEDGFFNDEPSELAKKVFLLGSLSGTVDTRIEYLDGSRDHVKSYCADGTYFIEHL